LPIAEVTALSFIAPIFVVIGAVAFLRERLTRPRIIAVALGLVGVLIILRPGVAVVQWGALAMLAAAPLFAASKVLTKFLVRDDSSGTLVVYLSIYATLTMLAPALWVWQSPSQSDLVFLAGTAIFATTSHLCIARGLALVDVTVSQPIDFLQLVWSTMIGLIFFAESPVIWVWVGAGVVVFSATYMARLEARSVQQL
jgi:drug/metabolite transporter (DMT)-like permease